MTGITDLITQGGTPSTLLPPGTQINKTFGVRYQNTLADTCIAIVTLLETMVPEQVTKVIQAAGISKEQMLNNWFKENGKVIS